jgi:hypothetical protein
MMSRMSITKSQMIEFDNKKTMMTVGGSDSVTLQPPQCHDEKEAMPAMKPEMKTSQSNDDKVEQDMADKIKSAALMSKTPPVGVYASSGYDPVASPKGAARGGNRESGTSNGESELPSLPPVLSQGLHASNTFDGDDDADALECEVLTDDEAEDEGNEDDGNEDDNESDDEAGKSSDSLTDMKEPARRFDSPPTSPTSPVSTPPLSPTNATGKRRFLPPLNKKTGAATASPRPPRNYEGKLSGTDAPFSLTPTTLAADTKAKKRQLTLTPLRAMKAFAGSMSSKTSNPKSSMDVPDLDLDDDDHLAHADEGTSSGESSSEDDSGSYGDDSDAFCDDFEQDVDFMSLPHIPNSFLNIPPDSYDYLDSAMIENIDKQDISKFAWEHHLLVHGLLQLLAERDHIGVEGDVHDSSNILKMGPLKKKFAQLWFVKYVEIRKGNLSYYVDSKNEGKSARKTIHLRKRTCTCQPVNKDSGSSGFSFEIFVEGRPKTSWMAKSEAERQAWIRAIKQAMIGETDVDGSTKPLDMSLYQNVLEVYQTTHSALQRTDTTQAYMVVLESLLYRQRSGPDALRVPVQWIREQGIVSKSEDILEKIDAPQDRVKSSISDFWKSLCNASVLINGHDVEAHSPYSGERVIGALSRCILEFDKCEDYQEEIGAFDRAAAFKRIEKDQTLMSELEAVAYARSILNAILHSKDRGDAYASINGLLQNESVVSVELESEEPLHIDVSFAGDDFSEYEPKTNDITGWIPTRTKKGKNFKERFFVVSEGVLSYYEFADPRPHVLRGQLVLGGATLNILEDDILQIQKKDQERQLQFESRGEFIKWKTIIERATGSQPVVELALPQAPSLVDTSSTHSTQKRRTSLVGAAGAGVKVVKGVTGGGMRVIKGATGGGMRVMKGAKDAGMKSFKSASGIIARGMRGTPKNSSSSRQRPKLDMLMTSTRNLLDDVPKDKKRDPTVQVVVELTSSYKVATTPNDGKEEILM